MDAGQPRPEDRHLPVMRDRVVDLLAPAVQAALEAGRTPVAVDGTLGMGGHTEALLTRFPHLRVIGIDRDAHAQAMAAERGIKAQNSLALLGPLNDIRSQLNALLHPGFINDVVLLSILRLAKPLTGDLNGHDVVTRVKLEAGRKFAHLLGERRAAAPCLIRLLS